MLHAIIAVEHGVTSYFARRSPSSIVSCGMWRMGDPVISKFAILEVVAFVFAGRAALGHFFEIVAIGLTLMASEALLGWIFRRLGAKAPT